MSLFCLYCAHELKAFGSLRQVWPKGKKADMSVACADLEACKTRRDERERQTRNAEPAKAAR